MPAIATAAEGSSSFEMILSSEVWKKLAESDRQRWTGVSQRPKIMPEKARLSSPILASEPVPMNAIRNG